MIEFLLKYAKDDNTSFHMPGHKGAKLFEKYGYKKLLECMADCDITEIQGADNLHQPEGIIEEICHKYESLYGAKKSFLLVNGTTSGIIASILSTVEPNEKLIMSRGCHKSTYNAVNIGGITPIYINPQIEESEKIMGAISCEEVERAILENTDAKAVIFPSPNYYGICSDIKKIADVVHKYGKILIIDQAHGAHLKFFQKYNCGENMPLPAEDQGADIVINSTHKTLGSFTQSAVLNVLSDRVDLFRIQEKLSIIQSTSPSYLLMASLDMNANMILNYGEEIFRNWHKNIESVYYKIKGLAHLGVKLMEINNFDRTKINIDLSQIGINGDMLNHYLMDRKIYSELVTGNVLMAMSGMGNTEKDYERLYQAIKEIAEEKNKQLEQSGIKQSNTENLSNDFINIKLEKGIRQSDDIESIDYKEAEGRISAAMIIPYPPGIPLACPEEIITREVIEEIKRILKENRMICGLSHDMHIYVYKNIE